jgi:CRISPR-associated protein Csd2
MALMHLFEGDASATRPEGSMEVRKMYWWKHEEPFPATSSARIIRNMECELKDGIDQPRRFEDYKITWNPIDGCVEPEIYEA